MKSLRRPAVYQGVTYPDYEIDFYTSRVYDVKKNKVLKGTHRLDSYVSVSFRLNSKIDKRGNFSPLIHGLLAETFYDLLSKSPLVSYYDLQIGQGDRREIKTPTGFNFLYKMVCPDHIDGDPSNNHHSNLMTVTQFENQIKRGSYKGSCSIYKGIYGKSVNYRFKKGPRFKAWQVQIKFKSTLDENGKHFFSSKNFRTEEEAALGYNTMLGEALLTIWGPELGLKMYDSAYKNVIKAPIQQELTL